MTRAGATISAVLDKASGALTATSSGGSLDDVSGVSVLRTGKLTSAVGFFRSQSEFRDTKNPYREFPK